jgi:electron transfer flavoprotein beta subunit
VKIVVPVKQVATLDEDFELRDDNRGVDPDFLEWDLNEWDTFSLEAALQIKEAAGDGEVVAVTVGDGEAEDGLLACLAKGADRAVRVWDDDLRDADLMAVARILAAAVEREQPDLVLCGVQSSDAVNGATGVALASFLGLPRVAVVKKIDYDHAGKTATVERELEGGLIEVLRVRTPALLTVQTGINEPRYANLRAIKQAKEKPMEEVSPDDLGLGSDDVAAASASQVTEMAPPPKGEGAEILEGDAASVAERIAAIIKEKVGVTA